MKKKVLKMAIWGMALLCIVLMTACGSATKTVAPEEETKEEETKEEVTDVIREGEYGYKRNADETYAYYSYSGKSSELTVPETSASGVAVTSVAPAAFRNKNDWKTVVLPSSVVSIGEYAFDGCAATIRWTDPTIRTIGTHAFAGYAGASLTVPDSVTKIEAFAFDGATAEIFWEEPSLTKLTENAFGNYAGRNLTVPGTVDEIEKGALYGCSRLERVTLPYVGGYRDAAQASAATLFGYVFGVSRYDGATAVLQRYAESSASTAYYLPDTLAYVTIEGGKLPFGAFYNCIGLREVTIDVQEVGAYAFFGCNGLERVSIRDAQSFGTHAFYGCTGLEAVCVDDLAGWCGATFRNNYANPLSYAHTLYSDDERVTSLDIPAVGRISAYAFYGCRSLEEVTIPASVKTIGASAFDGCDKLVHIRNDSVATVSSPAVIGGEVATGTEEFTTLLTTDALGVRTYAVGDDVYLFGYVGKDSNLDLSGYVNLTGVYPYALCSYDLNELVLPLNVAYMGEHAFDACKKLVHVRILANTEWEIKTGATIGVEVVYGAEKEYENEVRVGKDGVVTYTVDKEVYLLGYAGSATALTLSDYAKEGAAQPTEPETPEETEPEETGEESGEGSGEESGEGSGEESGEEPEQPTEPEPEPEPTEQDEESDKIVLTAIYPYALYGKTTLLTLEIPYGVAKIGAHAFGRCVSLREATLPSTVTQAEASAFEGCFKLVRLINQSAVSMESPAVIGGEVVAKKDGFLASLTASAGVWTYEIGGRTFLFGYEEGSEKLSLTKYKTVAAIYPYAFYGNRTLSRITLSEQIAQIGENAFAGLKKAVQITNNSELDVRTAALGGEVVNAGGKFSHALRSDDNGVWTYYADDKVYLFGYTGTKGDVDLSGNTSITDVYPYAFAGNSTITFVRLPDSVTTIPEGTFSGCVNLTGITLPKSLLTVGNNAFDGCVSLDRVTVATLRDWCELTFEGAGSNPMYYAKTLTLLSGALSGEVFLDGVTAIPDYSFRNNSTMTSVTLSETVREIGAYAFYGCTALRTVRIEGGGMRDIKDHAFAACGRLATLKMGDGVKNVWSHVFENCVELADVTLSGALKNLGANAFNGCVALRRLDIPAGLKTVGANAFLNCPLTSVTVPTVAIFAVPKDRLQRVEITNGTVPFEAFRGCLTLTELTVGSGVSGIGGSAFYGCASLTSVTVSASVTSVGTNAFYGCPITEAHIPTIVIPYLPKNALTTLEITSGRSIGESAFSNCVSMTNVRISKSVMSFGKLAFGGCGNLLHVYYEGTRAEWNAIDKYVTSDGAESWDFGTTTYTIHCEGDNSSFSKEVLR